MAPGFSHSVLWEKFEAVAEAVAAVEHFETYWQVTPSLPNFASLPVYLDSIDLVALALVGEALLVEVVVAVVLVAVVAMYVVVAVLVFAAAKPVVAPGMGLVEFHSD